MKTKHLICALATTAVLAGCGGDDRTDDAAPDPTEPDDTTTTEPEESPAATEPASDTGTPAETDAPDEDAEVQVDESSTLGIAETSLGTILVDGEGMTLYMFDSDDQGATTCYDDCAANWPPVTVEGGPAGGESIDAALLGTTERDDGSLQVTYNDWPLYRWVQDDEPGAVSGQGVNDVWWVIGPDGTPIRE